VLDLCWLSSLLGLLVGCFSRTGPKDGGCLSRAHLEQLFAARSSSSARFVWREAAAVLTENGVLCSLAGEDSFTVPSLLSDERPHWFWPLVTGGTALLSGPADTAAASAPEVRRVFSQQLIKFGTMARLMAELARAARPLRMWRYFIIAELHDDPLTRFCLEAQVFLSVCFWLILF
jgi:hypothetical protein